MSKKIGLISSSTIAAIEKSRILLLVLYISGTEKRDIKKYGVRSTTHPDYERSGDLDRLEFDFNTLSPANYNKKVDVQIPLIS